jgi:hypothetical protein
LQSTPITDAERKLRTVRYARYGGPWSEPKSIENSLLAVVYDIPYLAPCGIFPPFRRDAN